jgi:hypothetical protein
MGAMKSASSGEVEQDRRIGLGEEEKSTVQNLHKAASDVTVAARI